MSAPVKETKNQALREYQLVLKIKEEIVMKLAELHIRVSKALNTRNGAKLVGGMAFGAMLMTAVALPIGGTTYADDPVKVIPNTINYADMEEFEVTELGQVAARLAPSTTAFVDMEEFEVTELGQVAARLTPSTTNYADMEEFEVTEVGQVAARLTPSTIDYGDEGI